MSREITNLAELLEQIGKADSKGNRVSLDAIFDAVGRRSFGPILLVAGLITFAPVIGDIPGVPTLMAALVLLVSVQLLFHRDHFWMPQWLLKRSVKRDQLRKALDWMQRPARFVDRFLRPRLIRLVEGPGLWAIAVVCVAIASAMPPMELIPFSATGAGAALTAFGLALVAHDGLFALFAMLITITTAALVLYAILGS